MVFLYGHDETHIAMLRDCGISLQQDAAKA